MPNEFESDRHGQSSQYGYDDTDVVYNEGALYEPEGLRERARMRGRRAANQIEDTYEQGKERLEQGIERHPLAMGLGFFGVGLLIGLSIPRTRREREWFGDASEDLVERARDRGYDIVHRGVEAGRRAWDATREELHDQGLAPRQVSDKARRVVNEGVHAAREAARDAGRTPEEMARRADELRERAQAIAQHEAERIERQF